MDTDYLDVIMPKLRLRNVRFAPGLTDDEVAAIEARYSFRFPPDLRGLLQHALPITDASERRSWVNWREEPEASIRERLEWPSEGICFDIEHSGFWMPVWGPRPTDLEDAFRIAKRQVEQAPTLIPVCGHRYLPDEPPLAGNPIFSVWQTDIIHYGNDLAAYIAAEYQVDPLTLHEIYIPVPDWSAKSPRPIRFWDEIMTFQYPG